IACCLLLCDNFGSGVSNMKLITALVLAVALPVSVHSQTSKTWTPPKTPWGDPDIQGIWPGNVGVPMQRPANFGERSILTDTEFRQREAQAKRQAETDNQAFATTPPRGGIGPPSYWTGRGRPTA